MNNNPRTELFRHIKVLVVAIALFFGLQGLFASSLLVGPATLNSTVEGPITVGSTAQIKTGKFGINGLPPLDYNFIVNKSTGPVGRNNNSGIAMFKGGVRTGSAYFDKDVVVGSVVPSAVSVYGDIKVLGGNGSITNDRLRHTRSTPQPVCSDTQGVLNLCTPLVSTN